MYWKIPVMVATVFGALLAGQAPRHFNPMIDLLEARRPMFGLYAPSNRRLAPRPGGAVVPDGAPRTPAQLAADAMGQGASDFVFDGAMEDDFDGGLATFSDFAAGARDSGPVQLTPWKHLHHPLAVKTPEIALDLARARARIATQLNLGVSTIVFVGVESATEVRDGLAMMRFKRNGGSRPDEVGMAPAYWGMSAAEYTSRADVWPLNPAGELVNWTIVESKEGLAHVREIAAVKGIGVLFPGAGTLRGVFSTTDADGKRVVDEVAWEAAVQQVLAACKEFSVACGYPAGLNDIETRMRQGFSVFVIGWGANGFKALDVGRRAAGRAPTNAEEWR